MKERGALDLPLVSVVLMLLGLGLVMVYSSSAVYAMEKYGSSTYFFWRQLTWAGVGAAAGVTFIFYDHRKLRRWVKPSLIACAVVLALVLVFGKEVSGARRWLKLGWFGFQPSEFAKLILIVFTAYYCDKKKNRIHSFPHILLERLTTLLLVCKIKNGAQRAPRVGLPSVDLSFRTSRFWNPTAPQVWIIKASGLKVHFSETVFAFLTEVMPYSS